MRMTNRTGFAVILLLGWNALTAIAQPQPPPARGRSTTDEALHLYARLTGRTVLRPGFLPRLPESIAPRVSADTNSAIDFIESVFATNQIEILRVGQLFAWVLPEGWKETPLAAQLARIKPPTVRESAATADEQSLAALLQPGDIDLQDMPLEQLVQVIYPELRNRTVLRPSELARVGVRFWTQSSMTKEEAIYALNVMLAMNGVAVIDDGDKFVQIVPLPRAAKVVAKAPLPEEGAELMSPDKVPVFMPGYIEEPARPLTAPANADGLVAFYAGLTGRKPAPSEPFGRLPIFLKVQTPLTKAELLYAIETTLALNNLAIVPGDGDSIRAGRPGEMAPSQTTSPRPSQ